MTPYERKMIGRWPTKHRRGDPATWDAGTTQRFLHNARARAIWGDGLTTHAENLGRLKALDVFSRAIDGLEDTADATRKTA